MFNCYGLDFGIWICIMCNLVFWWNVMFIFMFDNKLVVDCFVFIYVFYDVLMDYNRMFGCGVGVVCFIYFVENLLWYFNGNYDDGDLRYNLKVGNWVYMEDLKYNNFNFVYYGKYLSYSCINDNGEE